MQMNQFMIVMRGSHKEWNTHSPEEIQRIMERYHAYIENLKKENRFKGGSALKDGSHHFRTDRGKVVVDGPFTETKEALNGYFVFEAKDEAEAVDIAKRCPALTHGETVELLQLTSHGEPESQ